MGSLENVFANYVLFIVLIGVYCNQMALEKNYPNQISIGSTIPVGNSQLHLTNFETHLVNHGFALISDWLYKNFPTLENYVSTM